jgi:hypothetical protein
MKRIFAFAFLPVVFFALEPVNLIKDGGFEKDSELWLEHSKIYGFGDYDSTVYNRHDPDSAYIGKYCGSIDGRKRPAQNLPFNYGIKGRLYQIILFPKQLKDLDSLELFHMCLFRIEGSKYSAWGYGADLYFTRSSDGILIHFWYGWAAPDLTSDPDSPTFKGFRDTIATEGIWYSLKRDLKADLIGVKGLSEDIELDTFLLYECSWLVFGVWRSQKAFFDGIRLTGYADYDVGVKYLLSPDSIGTSEALGESLCNSPLADYTPVAGIKNFGREDAPEFSVIAEIWEGETCVYYDSLPWSLEGDTEDTVTFADFTPSNAANHTLTVRTVMEPDESDEDDELSKTLYGTGIAEPVTHPDAITLQVRSITAPLQVSYALPYGESGTLTLYDAAGRRIERMTVKGSGSVEFDSALPSGVYIVRLETEQTTITRKAVVLR